MMGAFEFPHKPFAHKRYHWRCLTTLTAYLTMRIVFHQIVNLSESEEEPVKAQTAM